MNDQNPKTVVGPLKTQKEADETAKALGNQFSAYGREIKDTDGYGTDVYEYFVEQDTTIVPDRIFGFPTDQFMARQYKRG